MASVLAQGVAVCLEVYSNRDIVAVGSTKTTRLFHTYGALLAICFLRAHVSQASSRAEFQIWIDEDSKDDLQVF